MQSDETEDRKRKAECEPDDIGDEEISRPRSKSGSGTGQRNRPRQPTNESVAELIKQSDAYWEQAKSVPRKALPFCEVTNFQHVACLVERCAAQDKIFSSQNALREHMRQHLGINNSFQCRHTHTNICTIFELNHFAYFFVECPTCDPIPFYFVFKNYLHMSKTKVITFLTGLWRR